MDVENGRAHENDVTTLTPEDRAAKKAAWMTTYKTHPKRHPKWKYPDGKPPARRDQRPRVRALLDYIAILEAALRRAKGEAP